ncbi:Putative phosphoglycolate phosphatase-like, domain 2, HAD superfamily [Septoria linicola]|uniref:Phosphoglycolate phosphatase-like, domain 2, HAD superfamily n=1 Tax=Septoria linicola TaxID=215465 RepID=A0A9Q9ELB2_9PEZI|nr:Putative phosphoglycolate phosphatase-like, domain 2, HAD superfamily [Septoria linicola]
MPPPVRACLFDMDGLLLNTEDLITTCINIVLARYGKPALPWSVKARMQGRTAEQSNEILQNWAQLPLAMPDLVAELRALHEQMFPNAELLPGVGDVLEKLLQRREVKELELALATSSSRVKFELKTRRWTKLFDECFPEDCRVMGDDSRVIHHKPAPDIYLCALGCVNARFASTRVQDSVRADECLVLEDSVQGVEAGRQAGMQVIWCPHPALLEELLQGEAEDAIHDFRRVFGIKNKADVQGLSLKTTADVIEKASDGWVTLVPSLQQFPYARYGL